MSSPAQRFAASRARARYPQLQVFTESLDFPLDDFQIEAIRHVEDGKGVLVAAPTGAGKTVVGEFAVHLALAQGRKAFYTTPIKALSNQKYHDLVRRHGAEQVGLLTGDSSINGEAPIVVMTTEVLRNMMYAASTTLVGLGFVVMDEVHYLADRFRGAVWEEVIIHLPQSVQVVSLSATVSNAEEFGAWLAEVRGEHDIVVSEHRPVPLWQHLMIGGQLVDLFDEDQVNPEAVLAIRNAEHKSAWIEQGPSGGGGHAGHGMRGGPAAKGRARRDGGPRRSGPGPADRSAGRPGGGRARGGAPSRVEVISALEREGLLPAITFIFSRVGCDAAVGQMLAAGVRLIPERQGERIRRRVEEKMAALEEEDLSVLGYFDFVEGLTRGFAAHHAGMLPLFREIVEELFTTAAIRAVFATETLALGINMPAKTVVIEKLTKFNGDTHAELTPAEYTQLTGRAGRRGIDIDGHAVVLWHRGLDPLVVAGLASTRTYPLRSSFRPTYNMAVNLVSTVGRETAAEILETSFAQFQADRAVVGMAGTIRRNAEALDAYAEAMQCHLGDFASYAAIRHQINQAQKDGAKSRSASLRAAAEVSLTALRIGDVIKVPSGRRAGWAVVIAPARTYRGVTELPTVVTEERQVKRLTLLDVPRPVEAVAQVRVPARFNPKNPKARRELATSLRIAVPSEPTVKEAAAQAAAGEDRHIEQLRHRLRSHPCHQCPDREEHARWAERWWRLKRETTTVQRKVDNRTTSVAKTFERICDVLADLGYLDPTGAATTDLGDRLRRIYTEKDLLAAQSLRSGIWSRLDAPSLAAAVSALIHEPRHDDADPSPRMPNADVAEAISAMVRLWSEITDLEADSALPQTGAPDGGMAWMVHRWASGQSLDLVLRGQDMAAGDFVRRCKQLVDLLDQIAGAAGSPQLRGTARKAVQAVRRGVVAADRLD